jgi:hypothetical protein
MKKIFCSRYGYKKGSGVEIICDLVYLLKNDHQQIQKKTPPDPDRRRDLN